MPTYRSASGSSAEDLFIELFSDTFGAEKAGYLYSQYPFSDIYQNSRFADFLIENGGRKVAIEIDDEASHNPKLVSQNKFYDDLLKQYDGSLKLRYTLDAAGHTLTLNPPEVLRDNYKSEGGVALTLDADFQRIAQRAMKGVEKGAAVVMDVATGDVKASVSVPAYDANDLAASLQDPDSPFVNRAFSQYNVGSTFKLVVAALESGVSRYERYTCEGYADVGGHIFYCHWRNGHGNIDLKKAIEISCNPFFIHLGLETGGKNIVSMAREIGFTRAAQFTDDIRTQSGTLPSDAELERRGRRKPLLRAGLPHGHPHPDRADGVHHGQRRLRGDAQARRGLHRRREDLL